MWSALELEVARQILGDEAQDVWPVGFAFIYTTMYFAQLLVYTFLWIVYRMMRQANRLQ